jgi:hypothetical protein
VRLMPLDIPQVLHQLSIKLVAPLIRRAQYCRRMPGRKFFRVRVESPPMAAPASNAEALCQFRRMLHHGAGYGGGHARHLGEGLGRRPHHLGRRLHLLRSAAVAD